MKIILKESELINLIEVAMDLDIYSQQNNISTDNGNLDSEQTVEDIIDKLKEILYMLKSGKKIDSSVNSRLYNNFDDFNDTYSRIKY